MCAQASQQVQQAWANVKGKEPLNRRASNMASSSSNVGDHLPRQPSQNTSDQPQRSANNNPEQPQSRRGSRDSFPQSAQANSAGQRDSGSGGVGAGGHSGPGQLHGRFNAGPLAAALGAGPLQGADNGQNPFAGQGDPQHQHMMLSACKCRS